MVTNNVINFRCSAKVTELLDEAAARDNRTRSNLIDTLLLRALDRKRISWPLEQLVSWIQKDDAEHPQGSNWGDYCRGSLHGAKWMLETILGKGAKERALQDVREALSAPIPHCGMRDREGNRFGFDSDAG
jgi:hypothetical protein